MPAARSRADAFGPDADVRGAGDLPVLIVAGAGPGELAAAVAALAGDLADAVVDAGDAARTDLGRGGIRRRGDRPVPLADRSVAVLNRGTPGCVVTPGRHAAHVADALVQRVAVRDMDRRGPPHRAGRQQLRLAALEPHVRVRAGLRARATGGRPGFSPAPRTTTTT